MGKKYIGPIPAIVLAGHMYMYVCYLYQSQILHRDGDLTGGFTPAKQR